MKSFYEHFPLPDPECAIWFHPESETPHQTDGFYLHWHEHMELLQVTKGTSTFCIDNAYIDAGPGDIIVIDSGALHSMPVRPSGFSYQCLILSKRFCDDTSIPFDSISLPALIQDPAANALYAKIATEIKHQKPYYKAAVKANTLALLLYLARSFAVASSGSLSLAEKPGYEKKEIAKKTIRFLYRNISASHTLDSIARQLGFSKSYLSHVFKEVTGSSITQFTNHLRCVHARNLMLQEHYNVSEAAHASGFTNLSYFTKTYKKYVGVVPSAELSDSPLASE